MKSLLKVVMCTTAIGGLLFLGGCGTKPAQSTGGNTGENPQQTQTAAVDGLTKENPIKFDKQAGTVTYLAEVNGKYAFEPTRHGVVFKDGSNGEKAIFRGYAEPKALYDALVAVGAKPGDNMTPDNKATTHVQGSALDVFVTWNGATKEYPLAEVVKDSNGKAFDIRFGGNLKRAVDVKTGCLICLDSCPVGVTSNSAYTFGAVEDRKEVGFTGIKDVLPADGTLVAVKMTLKK